MGWWSRLVARCRGTEQSTVPPCAPPLWQSHTYFAQKGETEAEVRRRGWVSHNGKRRPMTDAEMDRAEALLFLVVIGGTVEEIVRSMCRRKRSG